MILIGHLRIASIEGGFGDAPGDPERSPIFPLTLDDQAVGLLEQAPDRRAHHKEGIRYSNMEPDQEISAEPMPTGAAERPNLNQ